MSIKILSSTYHCGVSSDTCTSLSGARQWRLRATVYDEIVHIHMDFTCPLFCDHWSDGSAQFLKCSTGLYKKRVPFTIGELNFKAEKDLKRSAESLTFWRSLSGTQRGGVKQRIIKMATFSERYDKAAPRFHCEFNHLFYAFKTTRMEKILFLLSRWLNAALNLLSFSISEFQPRRQNCNREVEILVNSICSLLRAVCGQG